MKRLLLCVLVLCAACGVTVVRGAYLESGTSDVVREPDVRVPERVIPPLRHDARLPGLLARVRVGQPFSQWHLTVYPLELGRGSRSGFVTMEDAIRAGDLDVRERDSASVQQVLMRNAGRVPVFVLAGEIVLGGKQNRIVRDDVLLPSRSGWIDVSVYCGEQDRWAPSAKGFERSDDMVGARLRGLSAGKATQDRIWGQIASEIESAEVLAPTRSYQDVHRSDRVQEELKRCEAAFRRFCRRDTGGCVVVSHGQILGADLFSDPSLFARLWPRICRSYGVDVITKGWHRHGESRWESDGVRRSVEDFVDGARRGRYGRSSTPGIGTLWDISGEVRGSALDYDGEAVHGSWFPHEYHVEPRPPIEPYPMPEPRPWRWEDRER